MQRMKRPDSIDELLIKYFRNECSREELLFLLNWFKTEENENELIYYLQKHWESLSNDVADTSINYHKLLDRINLNISERLDEKKRLPKVSAFYWYQVAAVFLLIVSSVFSFYYYFQYNAPIDPDLQIVYNPKGEKSDLILPDGTKIWLNSESTLSYSRRFDQSERSVYLKGEAYFDVKRNDSVPFIINTSELKIKVLGTSFNVSAYPDDENVTTTLVNGAVAIEALTIDQKEDIILNPSEQANFSKADKNFELEKVDIELYTSWKDGRLIFKDEKFEDVATKLERWYNINIMLLDENIKNERFTGKLEYETLEQLLEMVNMTTPIHYTISGDKVLIKIKNN